MPGASQAGAWRTKHCILTQIISQNHRRDAPAINPTKKSRLFEVPLSVVTPRLSDIWPGYVLQRRPNSGARANGTAVAPVAAGLPHTPRLRQELPLSAVPLRSPAPAPSPVALDRRAIPILDSFKIRALGDHLFCASSMPRAKPFKISALSRRDSANSPISSLPSACSVSQSIMSLDTRSVAPR